MCDLQPAPPPVFFNDTQVVLLSGWLSGWLAGCCLFVRLFLICLFVGLSVWVCLYVFSCLCFYVQNYLRPVKYSLREFWLVPSRSPMNAALPNPIAGSTAERRHELTSPQQLVPTRGIGCRYYKTTPSGAVCKVRRYKRPGILGGTQESRFLAGSKLPTPRRDPNDKKSSNRCVRGTHL